MTIQQYLLTLMKLRLNLGDKDLAIHFSVSQPSVSRYFKTWVDHLFVRLSFLIMWPERDLLERQCHLISDGSSDLVLLS